MVGKTIGRHICNNMHLDSKNYRILGEIIKYFNRNIHIL